MLRALLVGVALIGQAAPTLADTTGPFMCPDGSNIYFRGEADGRMVIFRPSEDSDIITLYRAGQRVMYDHVGFDHDTGDSLWEVRGAGGEEDVVRREEFVGPDGVIYDRFDGIAFEMRCQSPDGEIDVAYDEAKIKTMAEMSGEMP